MKVRQTRVESHSAFTPGDEPMAVHDWKQVRAGIFHDFHHEWISSIKHMLNDHLLPEGYYSAAEQYAGGIEADVLTLESSAEKDDDGVGTRRANGTTLLTKPRRKATAESEMEFYRRKINVVAVRHVSDDGVVAVVEIVSPGNKGGTRPLRAFVDKAAELLDRQIHLLIVDVFPPGRRDPSGVHGAIWEEITGEEYRLPKRKPLTVVSYEAAPTVRAYVEHFAIGSDLPDMPLFLEPRGCVELPLETTYRQAFKELPKEWRKLLSN